MHKSGNIIVIDVYDHSFDIMYIFSFHGFSLKYPLCNYYEPMS